MNESALISLARTGDVNAFNEIVLAYQDLAYSVAFRILQNENAADITQNAFIAAYQKLEQFKGGSFKAWVLRIVTNACYDELRRHKRRPTTSLDDLQEDSDGLSFNDDDMVGFAVAPDSPERAVQRSELRHIIEDCIQALSDDHRVVVVMVDVEQYSYDEVSEIAGVSLGTIKSRLSRARASLRDCLQQSQELLPEQYRLNKEE